MANPKRAIALILSLFVLIVLGGFISLATYQYVADRLIHQHYENSIKSLYAIETARSILLWEEANAPTVNSWDTDSSDATYNSDIRFPGIGAAITDKFYRFSDTNSGFDIKARVKVISGNVYMYIMAYKGDEDAPQEAQYLEYVHSPSPMYKYAIFSNTSITFSGSKLYDLKGGSVHSNGDLVFQPSSYGIRFNNMAQMTASGTIKYGKRYSYPAARIIDDIDGVRDGMSPAPALSSNHYQTTTGEAVSPGPFRYWSTNADGVTSLADRSYADYVAGNWGNYNGSSYPLIFRGDETYFYGNQTGNGSYYPNAYERTFSYLKSDGTYGGYSSSTKSTVNKYYLSGTSLYSSTSTSGYYQGADVYFKPYTTSDGSTNTEWFELPGSLPQTYSWTDKYVSSGTSENAVTFYITESCTAGSASCKASAASGTATTGWRYMKKDQDGNTCTTDDCYTNKDNAYNSNYVKAQDYKTGATSTYSCSSSCNAAYSACYPSCYDAYYSCYDGCYTTYGAACNNCWNTCTTDEECNACDTGTYCTEYYNCDNNCYENNYYECMYGSSGCYTVYTQCNAICTANPEQLNYYQNMSSYYTGGTYNTSSRASSWTNGFDINNEFISDYAYGGDVVSGKSTSLTTAFNSLQQPEGFAQYLNMLSQKNISGVLDSGVAKKDPYLGNLFDAASTGDSAYKAKAQSAGIYLNGTQSPSDIVSALNSGLEAGLQFASVDTFYNWKTALTTEVVNIDVGKMKAAMAAGKVSFSNGVLYSEVPVMLSNAEDLPGASSGDKTAVFTLVSEESVYLKGDYNTTNWKISNIATQKKVYTLSDAFNASTLPDPTVYTNYPYIKVSVVKDSNNKIISYEGISGDQSSAVGNNEIWVNADYVDDTYATIDGTDYAYYQGMGSGLRGDIQAKRTSLQSAYVAAHTKADGTTTFPNNVDKAIYNYNSLFVTPYDTETLENWVYNGTQATRNLTGAFLNFYNSSDSRYDDEYLRSLGENEYCRTSACSGGFNYRDRQAPKNSLSSITAPISVQSYDGNFPTANPTSSEGVLGFTGQNSWRPISKEYFNSKTNP